MLILQLLPTDFDPADYGKTIFVGDDVAIRREVLGQVSVLYLVVEGGPGTEHEAAVAMANNATLVPVGRSGGCAKELYSQLNNPKFASDGDWQILGESRCRPGSGCQRSGANREGVFPSIVTTLRCLTHSEEFDSQTTALARAAHTVIGYNRMILSSTLWKSFRNIL